MNYFDNLFKVKNNNYYGVAGLTIELNAIYIYNTFLNKKEGVLVVANSLYEANDLYQKILNYTDRVLLFPMDDFITSEALAISPEFQFERVNTLNKLINDNNYIVVTNLMGVLRYLPETSAWKNSFIAIKTGDDINREELINKLYSLGYEVDTLVTETGKMGIRGYVIDIFPIGEENPIRIEFWGDTIDSIKYFNVENQLSIKEIDKVLIMPVSEFILDKYDEDIITKQKYLLHYAKKVNGIWDYIGNKNCIFYDYVQIISAYKLLRETINSYDKENVSTIKTDYMFDLKDIKCQNEIFLMNFDNIIEELKLHFVDTYYSKNIEKYNGNYELIKKDLEKYMLKKQTVILCMNDKRSARRVVDYLEIEDIYMTTADNIIGNKINVIVKEIGNGFIFDNCIVIGEADLFNGLEHKKKYKNKFKMGTKINDLANISKGDYIVHEQFGIGIYDSLCTLTKNGLKKDYLKIVYAGGDVLYIPVEKIDRISKFSGKEGVIPKINKLGTDEWKKKKARVRGRILEIAQNLLNVAAER